MVRVGFHPGLTAQHVMRETMSGESMASRVPFDVVSFQVLPAQDRSRESQECWSWPSLMDSSWRARELRRNGWSQQRIPTWFCSWKVKIQVFRKKVTNTYPRYYFLWLRQCDEGTIQMWYALVFWWNLAFQPYIKLPIDYNRHFGPKYKNGLLSSRISRFWKL